MRGGGEERQKNVRDRGDPRPDVPAIPHSGVRVGTGGALLLPLLGAVSFGTTLHEVAAGRDVYLFMVGMMMLAELARREGLSDPARSFPGTQAQAGMGGSCQAPVVHHAPNKRQPHAAEWYVGA